MPFLDTDTRDFYATLTAEERLAAVRRHRDYIVSELERTASVYRSLVENENMYAAGYVAGQEAARCLVGILDAVLGIKAPTPEETVHGEP